MNYVTIDDVVMPGHPPATGPAVGLFVGRDGPSGVDDVLHSSLDLEKREFADGDRLSPVRLGSRSIEVSGWALARSRAELESLRLNLAGLAPRMREGDTERTLTVQRGTDLKWCRGVVSEIRWVPSRELPRAQFMVSFTAPESFMFGQRRSQAGASVFHAGNVEAAATVTVFATSSMSSGYGLRLLEGATSRGYLRFNSLAANGWHVIDTSEGIARTGSGTLVLGSFHSGAPFLVPPGREFSFRVEPVSGAGRVDSVVITDTYL